MNPADIIDKYKDIRDLTKLLEFVNLPLDSEMTISSRGLNPVINIPNELKPQVQEIVKDWLTRELNKTFKK